MSQKWDFGKAPEKIFLWQNFDFLIIFDFFNNQIYNSTSCRKIKIWFLISMIFLIFSAKNQNFTIVKKDFFCPYPPKRSKMAKIKNRYIPLFLGIIAIFQEPSWKKTIYLLYLERKTGFEPAILSMGSWCHTTRPLSHIFLY